MKVLHVITESNLGGAQRNTLLSLQGIVRHGGEAHLACGPHGPGDETALIREAEKAGATVWKVKSLVRRPAPIRDLAALLALMRIMARHEYDIVHTHSFKAGLLGRLAAGLLGAPVVVHTFHGVPFDTRSDNWKTRLCFFLERLQCRLCDKLVSVGEVLRRELIANNVAKPEKIVTVRSGVDFSLFDDIAGDRAVREELGVPAGAPIVGFVGRLAEQKAPEVLLHAFIIVKRRAPGAHLVFIGEGPGRDHLIKATTPDLQHCVHLLGERHDVPRLLAAMDVFALPSRWEGVGRALTEAMYAKLPVVCTGVNGVPELVEDGVTGLISRPDDPADLAEKILALINDPARAAAIAQAGHEKVKALMASEAMVLALHELYRELVSASSLPPGHPARGVSCVRNLRQAKP
ncbi:MAG: glycosyltransferase family 4 protein [Planctomycetes bacterium]|nr:glycosyltransferase family 4 protein [Planctomycetota bacterium]